MVVCELAWVVSLLPSSINISHHTAIDAWIAVFVIMLHLGIKGARLSKNEMISH